MLLIIKFFNELVVIGLIIFFGVFLLVELLVDKNFGVVLILILLLGVCLGINFFNN